MSGSTRLPFPSQTPVATSEKKICFASLGRCRGCAGTERCSGCAPGRRRSRSACRRCGRAGSSATTPPGGDREVVLRGREDRRHGQLPRASYGSARAAVAGPDRLHRVAGVLPRLAPERHEACAVRHADADQRRVRRRPGSSRRGGPGAAPAGQGRGWWSATGRPRSSADCRSARSTTSRRTRSRARPAGSARRSSRPSRRTSRCRPSRGTGTPSRAGARARTR